MRNVILEWSDRLLLRAGRPEAMRQVGALTYAIVEGQAVFLLITSRRTGRWIFPKGSPIDGLTPWQTASQEALEEAGVEGDIATEPIGAYRTVKTLALRRAVVEVDMYPMQVTMQHTDWQEKGTRRRHWVLLAEARRLLNEPSLAALAAKVSHSVMSGAQPAKAFMRT